MAKKEDCIFCKIANHDIESDYVYEDDLVCAFKDMNPQAPVHVLVVPKDHYDNIVDDVVAKRTGIDKTGFRVIANTGEAAGQTVMHLHMHVLGGKPLGERII